MNRTFDFFEYAAGIVPGSVLVVGLLWLFPEARAFFSQDGLTFGELGLFVVIAYAVGQLVQGIGNWIEWAWWKLWGGFPSRRVLAGELLTADQHTRLVEALRKDGEITNDISKCSSTEWLAIGREVYSIVADAGKATRVDAFNGNYSLVRGLAASLLVLLITAIVTAKGVPIVIVLAALFLLAIQRMHRFGKHYALELFIQYLLVSDGSKR